MKTFLTVLATIPAILLVVCMVTIQDKGIEPRELPGRLYGLICTTLIFSIWVMGIVAYSVFTQKPKEK